MTDAELVQALAEQGPVTCLVVVLLVREWRAHLVAKAAEQTATLDDLVTAVARLQTSIESLQGEFRAWFEQKIL